MQVNLSFDPKTDSYEELAAMLEAAFVGQQIVIAPIAKPHLNMTASEIAEGDALVAGVTSYGEQFNMSHPIHVEMAGKPQGQDSPLAGPSLAAPSAGVNSMQANPAAAGVEVDTDGVIWDARIHASTKTKNADGRWKAKKGVDKAFAAQIMTELRTGATPQQVPGVTPLPAGGVLGSVENPVVIQAEPPAATAPTLAPTLAPVALAQPQPTPSLGGAAVAQNFEQFVEWATKHQQPWAPQGTVPFDVLVEALNTYNVKDASGNPDVQVLQSRADMIPHVHSFVLRKMGML